MSTLAEQIADLSPSQREVFIKRLPPAAAERAKQIISDWATQNAQEGNAVQLLPHQKLPPPHKIKKGALLSGGRGIGKTLTLANYISRQAETIPKLRVRVIAPTLSDAVNAVVLDPESGIMAHSPSASFRSSGVEGARVVWPNGSVCFLVGTPTLKDVDRLRALTNIDLDAFEEAAANPRLTEATKQAALSRRGKRLHHPIFVAASTPRSVPIYKEWLADDDVVVTHASMADNPYTPASYREYGESLMGTHLYEQEVLGNLVDDIPGALWKQANIDLSVVKDFRDAQDVLDTVSRIVVGVDPPSGHGTCGISVVGSTDPALDPSGRSRIVVLDDFSISDASPHKWGRRVIEAAKTYGAHIVAERNQGGLMVESTIMQAATEADSEFTTVTLANAAVSKERRAAPVALLWEMTPQRALVLPPAGDLTRLAKLIDELISWIPKTFSPDRLDAMVWAATYLMLGGAAPSATLQRNPPRHISTGQAFRNALMGRR